MSTSKHSIGFVNSSAEFIHAWLYFNSEVAQLKEEHKRQIEELQNRKKEAEATIITTKRDIAVSS